MINFKKFLLSVLVLGMVMQPVSAAFPDVPSTHPNYEAINYLQANGKVVGYTGGEFRPDIRISRAAFTKILLAMKYSEADMQACLDNEKQYLFPDVPADHKFARYICMAHKHQIVVGYTSGLFGPEDEITSAQSFKIISTTLGLIPADTVSVDPENKFKPFADVLANRNAIPTSINSLEQKITRGEMAEMVYRIDANITSKASRNYQELKVYGPKVASCQVFPADNPWNQDVSNLPVHPNSNNFISSIGRDRTLHPDFGSGTWDGGPIGIPYIVVDGAQSDVNINFTAYGDESDPGPYPVPLNAPIEGGPNADGDRHAIAIDSADCKLYELYRAFPTSNGWNADSGAVWNLNSNNLRPLGWTSADAAGLPIFPGLARVDEVQAGEIKHALRFTVSRSQRGYIFPATHFASSSTDANLPPMGLRVRLKADFDLSGFSGQSLVILKALKKYGMIVADNGSNWYISGAPSESWNNDDLRQLKNVPGSAFEAVDTGPVNR